MKHKHPKGFIIIRILNHEASSSVCEMDWRQEGKTPLIITMRIIRGKLFRILPQKSWDGDERRRDEDDVDSSHFWDGRGREKEIKTSSCSNDSGGEREREILFLIYFYDYLFRFDPSSPFSLFFYCFNLCLWTFFKEHQVTLISITIIDIVSSLLTVTSRNQKHRKTRSQDEEDPHGTEVDFEKSIHSLSVVEGKDAVMRCTVRNLGDHEVLFWCPSFWHQLSWSRIFLLIPSVHKMIRYRGSLWINSCSYQSRSW